MTFNGVELATIVKLGKLMRAADGHVHENELVVIALELSQFGVSDSATDGILADSDALEFSPGFVYLIGNLPYYFIIRVYVQVCQNN